MQKYKLPASFDVIRVRPYKHYICFYDARPKLAKHKYISRLNFLDPQDRQRLLDIRYALPLVRRRLLDHRCSRQSWSETLYGLSPEEISAATKTEEGAREETEDTKMDEAGKLDEKASTSDGCLVITPSRFVREAFGRLDILGPVMDEHL